MVRNALFIFSVLCFTFSCRNATKNGEVENNASLSKDSITTKFELDSLSGELPSPKERTIRYLYYNIQGLIGFYDDGTMIECYKCAFSEENLDNMSFFEPVQRYTIESDGSLLIVGGEHEYPKEGNKGIDKKKWVVIDYRWIEEPTKYN